MVWPSQEMTNGILIWFRIYFRCFISLDFKYVSVYAPFKWLPGLIKGLPRWLSSKESACPCRRCGLDPWVRKIPGSGRSPGEGNGNPLQYSCLENPMERRAWQAILCGVTESDSTKHACWSVKTDEKKKKEETRNKVFFPWWGKSIYFEFIYKFNKLIELVQRFRM